MANITVHELKGFDFSPWGGIEGFLRASRTGGGSNSAVLKRLVPELSKGVNMTAVAIASLPFDILWDNGSVFDTSADWKNKLGGMENPQKILYLIASSLCGGAAYALPTTTDRAIFNIQYLAPHTIQPYIDREGLQWFDRSTDQGKTERLSPAELIHFWLPDSDVEIGPAENHPLGNAALDAQYIWNAKSTMSIYGERGFVPITLLGAKGMPNKADRETSELFFDRLLRGGFNVLAKIVNSEALSLIRVGAGMDELKQSYIEILRQAKEGIADSFGIPTALYMSDNAFASEFDALRKQWYSASQFVNIYQTIQEVFSEQMLKQYGKTFRFRPETLEIFKKDESAQAQGLNTFVTAVTTDPKTAKLGMSIMGYELDKVQEAALEEIIADKEKAAEEAQELERQALEKPVPADEQTEKKPAPKAVDLSAEELKDLALWYTKSKVWFLSGKGTAVDWENKHLREEYAAPIRLKLADAKNELDIMEAFKVGEVSETPAPQYSRTEIIYLADAINNAAAKGLFSAETKAPPPMTFNLTTQMPAMGEPSVTFAPVIQPSEVAVQVTNEVQPAGVNVKAENNITVQPADVTVIPEPEQKKRVDIKVKRDGQGKIESATGKIE